MRGQNARKAERGGPSRQYRSATGLFVTVTFQTTKKIAYIRLPEPNPAERRPQQLSEDAGPIGVGCDVGGSIRIPAFMNGIFGMLTTPGVISIDGCIPPPKGYQCQMQRVGPMCRYAEDIALLVKAMASEETNCLNICSSFDHKKIRIFYMEGFRDMLVSPELSNDMKNALKRAVSHLEEKYDVDAVRIDLPLFMHAIDIISSCFSGHGRPSELMLSIHRDKGPVDWRSELPRLLMGRSVHSPGGVFTAMFEKKSCAAENESSTVSELSA
ncbi:hypothetical protein Y032_0050g2023 [Ancylostoma ceylanicum]|uniref:Amidase domain-containing protein n=1 Tax=Ancylostoma ceylanicum TaxID=53326 RepID=A0A016U8M4_9BILA|nr:hypothetical protein Y032_0050g2023 [Ancylostoma ceylanicum]